MKKLIKYIIQYKYVYMLSMVLLVACDRLALDGVSNRLPTVDAQASLGLQTDLQGDLLMDIDLRERLGVVNWGAKYHFTDNPILIEGAEQIQALGTSLIKLAVTRNYRNEYGYNSAGWENAGSIKELLMTNYFQTVLGMPFTVYSMVANEFSAVNWKNGLDSVEYALVEHEYYDAAKYLIEAYENTNKTFILQSWEGDNSLSLPSIPDEADRLVAIQGMIDYLNARQDGISRARNELGDLGVTVAGAAEMNWVPGDPSETFPAPRIVDEVIPHTHMDLYAFSSWGTTTPATADWLGNKIQYIRSKAPASTLYGSDNVYVGEFGCYEVHAQNGIFNDHSGEYQRSVVKKQLISALNAGAKWLFYWQLYCNGLRSGVANIPGEVYTNDELVGVWLIRADSSYTPTYTYFKDILVPPTARTVNTYSNLLLGSQNNTSYGQFVDLETGVAVTIADAKQDSPLIDMVSFHSNNTGVALAAPVNQDVANYIYNQTNFPGDYLSSWMTRNATQFRKVPTNGSVKADNFDEILTKEPVIAAFSEGGTSVTKISPLQLNDVVAFRTVDGKTGVLIIRKRTQNTSDYWKLDIKIER